MNFLRTLWNSHIAARIRGALTTAWSILCGVGLEADFQTRRFISTCLIILAINFVLFIVGFALNWNGPVILAAFSSSIMVLIAWKVSDLAVKIISSLGGEIPVVGTIVKPTTEELKKLLPPFLVFSLMLAFVAGIVAIRGVGYYTYSDLLIWSTIILFTAIFNIYIVAKVKIVGWVMIGFLYYILIGNYMWPIQVQGTLDWLERSTIKRAVVASDENKGSELVTITNNTPLYSFGFGKFSKEKTTTQTETVAKIVGRKNDPLSKEPMYEVILPVAENLYVNGENLYVPARLTKLVHKETSSAPVATPAVYNVVPQVSKGWRTEGADLVADLQPGEEIQKIFYLPDGVSTPNVVIPTGNYCFSLEHLQTIIIEEGAKKTIVHPRDHYDMGAKGEKRFRATALKGGATVILNVKRNI